MKCYINLYHIINIYKYTTQYIMITVYLHFHADSLSNLSLELGSEVCCITSTSHQTLSNALKETHPGCLIPDLINSPHFSLRAWTMSRTAEGFIQTSLSLSIATSYYRTSCQPLSLMAHMNFKYNPSLTRIQIL